MTDPETCRRASMRILASSVLLGQPPGEISKRLYRVPFHRSRPFCRVSGYIKCHLDANPLTVLERLLRPASERLLDESPQGTSASRHRCEPSCRPILCRAIGQESTTPSSFARGCCPLARCGRSVPVVSLSTAVLFDTTWAVHRAQGHRPRRRGTVTGAYSSERLVAGWTEVTYPPTSTTGTASSSPDCASQPRTRIAILCEDVDSACTN